MELFLLYLCLSLSCSAFITCIYTFIRVGRILRKTAQLDWQIVGDMAGDVGILKNSYQKLNNRLNGLTTSPKQTDVTDQIQQWRMMQQAQQTPNKFRNSGG